MTGQSPNFVFADALKQIWNTIKGLENKSAGQIKDELLVDLDQRGLLSKRSQDHASNPLDYWGKGNIPPDLRIVDYLAELGVQRAKLGQEWLNRFLRAAGYSAALRQERIRALYGRSDALMPSRPFDLPPRRGDFLGRKAELESVLEALASGWPVCLIEGIGGVGKTTLALEVAYACIRQARGAAIDFSWPRFAFVIWTSAEEGRLSLNDLLDTIAHRLGYPVLTQKPLSEKRQLTSDLLAQQPVLLIIDNFETNVDPAIPDSVVRLPPSVKVLLTSREEESLLAPIFKRYPPARIRVSGLPDAEALIILRQEARRLPALYQEPIRSRLESVSIADDVALLPLVKATDGNPKALTLALGYIADHAMPLASLVSHLYSAADSLSGLFDYFFQQAWERCSDKARALWQVISFFAAAARRDALQATAGLSGRYFSDALEEVLGRSLLDVEEGPDGEPRYRAHPLVRAYGMTCLRDAQDFEARARERWIEWYEDFLKRHDKEDWSEFDVLDADQNNILAVITWALNGRHSRAPSVVRYFWNFLYIHGHWRQCEAFTRDALEQATAKGDSLLRLWLASHLGWILDEQGRHDEASQHLHEVEAEILTMQQPTLLEKTDVLNYLGQVYLWKGDLTKAEDYETRFLTLAEEAGDNRSALVARYYLALITVRRGYVEEAEPRYRALVDAARHIRWERAEGYCAYRLAAALIQIGRVGEAENWLNHAGAKADRWNEPLLQAHVFLGHARLALKQSQLQERRSAALNPRELAEAALDLYQRIGAQQEWGETIEFLEASESNNLNSRC